MKLRTFLKFTAVSVAVLGLISGWRVYELFVASEIQSESSIRQQEIFKLGERLQDASDFLMNQMRRYSVSGNKKFKDAYWKEVNETKNRDIAVVKLQELGIPNSELSLIEKAKNASDGLIKMEEHAENLADAGKLSESATVMFSDNYDKNKAVIDGFIAEFQTIVNRNAAEEAEIGRIEYKHEMMILTCLIAMVIFYFIFVVIYLSMRLRSIITAGGKLEELSQLEGDLTYKLPEGGNDEIGSVTRSVNLFTESLRNMISLIKNNSSSISQQVKDLAEMSHCSRSAIEEIDSNIAILLSLSSQNLLSIEESNARIEEVSANSLIMTKSSTDGAAMIDESTKYSRDAMSAVHRVLNKFNEVYAKTDESERRIKQLVDAVHQISDFVQVITGIAAQTNLLALNAAIEAARAGDAGRGFSVVASDVRKLAEESSKAAGKVGTLTATLRDNGSSALEVTEELSLIFKDILPEMDKANETLCNSQSKLTNANDNIHGIVSIINEQAIANKEVADKLNLITDANAKIQFEIESIKKSASLTKDISEDVAKVAMNVNGMTENLTDLLKKFRVEKS